MLGFEEIRERLTGKAGPIVVVALFITGIVVLYLTYRHWWAGSSAEQRANAPVFIDCITGKAFYCNVHAGETLPVRSPFTGRRTGYPGTFAWWSANGTPLKKPDIVLLNEYLGKPGPTFDPRTNRLVLPAGLPPTPGQKPPPTKAQYDAYMAKWRTEQN